MRFLRICFVRYCEEWSDVVMGAYNVITRSDSDVGISCRLDGD